VGINHDDGGDGGGSGACYLRHRLGRHGLTCATRSPLLVKC